MTSDSSLIQPALTRCEHVRLMAASFAGWTGRSLFPDRDPASASPELLARWLYEAPFVVVSHGIEVDPVLNYGNRRALELWETTWEVLTQMPSRLTAEAPSREERARLLARVTQHGFIDDYSGVRISAKGRRFRILRAVVWNLVDDGGVYRGQAATFSSWEFLP